jgi:glycosyltransferase involved in cell wall biosynthesis
VVAHPSLSIVLPVHNAEQTLAGKIVQLLDILPDLTTRFEILVINDGSTDHTEEIAYELAREYPQIRVAQHETRRGHRAAVETGLAATSGDILFIQDEQAAIDSSKLHRLWELRNDDTLSYVPPIEQVQRNLMQRLAAWGIRLEETTAEGNTYGIQMIRRPAGSNADRTAAEDAGRSSQKSRADQPAIPGKKQPSRPFTQHGRPRSTSRS